MLKQMRCDRIYSHPSEPKTIASKRETEANPPTMLHRFVSVSASYAHAATAKNQAYPKMTIKISPAPRFQKGQYQFRKPHRFSTKSRITDATDCPTINTNRLFKPSIFARGFAGSSFATASTWIKNNSVVSA